MNWRLIFALAIPGGILLGLELALDWPTFAKRTLLLAALVLPVTLFGCKRQAAFANGIYTGLLTGLVAVIVLLLLWNEFASNCAEDVERYSAYLTSVGLKAVTYSLFCILGALWGLLVGSLAWLLAKILGLRKGMEHWSRLE